MNVREATPTDVAAIAKVHVDSWRTTYAGIVPDKYLSDLSYKDHEGFWEAILSPKYAETNYVYVAEDDEGNVVGFSSGGPERDGGAEYDGELYTVYLLAEHQRNGLGRRLTLAVADRLRREGFASMLLWVLKDNPACQFYEKLGGKPVKEEDANLGGTDLAGVAYAWSDINALLDQAEA